MGNLKPGVTYIYERDNDIIYARESGTSDRSIVGYVSNCSPDYREIDQVVKMCATDPAMQQMLDQLFVMYNLKKNRE